MEPDDGQSHGNDSHEGHYKGALKLIHFDFLSGVVKLTLFLLLILKGLWALIGLYVFFLGEKLMQIKRSKKEKKVILIEILKFIYLFFPSPSKHQEIVLKKAESSLLNTNINTIDQEKAPNNHHHSHNDCITDRIQCNGDTTTTTNSSTATTEPKRSLLIHGNKGILSSLRQIDSHTQYKMKIEDREGTQTLNIYIFSFL